eukprot:11196757-Lingulodinium_polyedra.AAC.1
MGPSTLRTFLNLARPEQSRFTVTRLRTLDSRQPLRTPKTAQRPGRRRATGDVGALRMLAPTAPKLARGPAN